MGLDERRSRFEFGLPPKHDLVDGDVVVPGVAQLGLQLLAEVMHRARTACRATGRWSGTAGGQAGLFESEHAHFSRGWLKSMNENTKANEN